MDGANNGENKMNAIIETIKTVKAGDAIRVNGIEYVATHSDSEEVGIDAETKRGRKIVVMPAFSDEGPIMMSLGRRGFSGEPKLVTSLEII